MKKQNDSLTWNPYSPGRSRHSEEAFQESFSGRQTHPGGPEIIQRTPDEGEDKLQHNYPPTLSSKPVVFSSDGPSKIDGPRVSKYHGHCVLDTCMRLHWMVFVVERVANVSFPCVPHVAVNVSNLPRIPAAQQFPVIISKATQVTVFTDVCVRGTESTYRTSELISSGYMIPTSCTS